MKTISKQCSYCESEEANKRPIGMYLVELKELNINGITTLATRVVI